MHQCEFSAVRETFRRLAALLLTCGRVWMRRLSKLLNFSDEACVRDWLWSRLLQCSENVGVKPTILLHIKLFTSLVIFAFYGERDNMPTPKHTSCTDRKRDVVTCKVLCQYNVSACSESDTFKSARNEVMLWTSVVASMDAPYLSSSSTTAMRFFLQATCSGVNPFCSHSCSRWLHYCWNNFI